MISSGRFGVAAIVVAALGAGCGDGAVSKFRISGNVGGAVAEGVTLALSGASSGTATSDANGAFSFTVEEGSYTVRPSLSGYSFSPQSRDVTVKGGNVAGLGFTATALTSGRSISGSVSGDVSAGVTISVSGPMDASAVTDASGGYLISGLAEGSYTVTPSLAGYTFDPPSRTLALSGGDALGVNFAAIAVTVTRSISGVVSGAAGAGVTVSASGPTAGSVVSGAGGAYTISGLAEGTYTVTPSLSGYTFDPPSRTIALTGADVANAHFVAAAITHSISGTVSGAVTTGVSVSLSGASTASTLTNSTGSFSFSGLAGGLYIVTPSFAGHTFTPQSRSVTVNGADVPVVDFTSAAVEMGVVFVNTDVTADTTWTSDNVYVVAGSIAVSATLAIQPGTVVKFQAGGGLVVSGKILAIGMTAAPIVFTSFKDDASGGDTNEDGLSSGAPADWSGIELTATGSAFAWCWFLYAGAADSSALWAGVEGAAVSVTNSTFAHHRPPTHAITAAAALGLTIAGADTVVAGNLFYDNRVPLSVNTIFDLDDSNLFDNSAAAPQDPQANEFNGVFLRGCGQASGIISWAENDVPLVVGTPSCSYLSVSLYTHLTLEPGVIMKFHHDGYLVVQSGALMTIKSGVEFTSINDDARLGDTNADGGAQAPTDTDWAGILEEDECVILPNIHYATCH